MSAAAKAGVVILVAIVALFVIEGMAIVTGQPTISEGMQRLTAAMGEQLLAGLSFLFGLITGWFVAHFTTGQGR
jgi:hypothetical protein